MLTWYQLKHFYATEMKDGFSSEDNDMIEAVIAAYKHNPAAIV